jgi:hypothetical protein
MSRFQSLFVRWFLMAAAASSVACGNGDLCVDGVYDGTLALEAEGYVFAESPSLLSPGSREVIPYSDMPFATCRVIGGLFLQRKGAILDSDHYPLLEELGSIGIAADDEGGPQQVDEISGFDGVVRFGGMGSVSRFGYASVAVISGFNAVERLEGTLAAGAEVTGFAALTEVDGDLSVRSMAHGAQLERIGGSAGFGSTYEVVDLPNLREVGGDLVFDGTRATSLGFPALARVGGNFIVTFNEILEEWTGVSRGMSVGGYYLANNNSPVRDSSFQSLLIEDEMNIYGQVKICGNGPRGEREPCSDL